MNRKHSMLLKILLFLFFFNCLSLYLYFSPHPKTQSLHRSSLPDNLLHRPPEKPQHQLREFDIDHAKPWPILPSYLPWSHQNTQVPLGSCEGYFGNGFTRRLDLLRPTAAGSSGWFRCLYSETLRSSICEGGRVRMVPERIKMSRGGERLEEVIGRGEEVELPEFEDGAFEVDGGDLGFRKEKKLASQDFLDRYVPEGDIMRHTMRALVRSIQVVETKEFECEEWVEEPTLLVTRFEYANLFHTVTDWYSAYVASRVTGLPNRPRLVFVDGHCVAPLEETWRALFSGIKYAKDFTGPVCFRHAILSPLGYETVLFKGLNGEVDCVGAPAHDLWQNPDTHKTARLSEFGEIIRASFGLPIDKHHLHKNASGHNVLFVRREDYLAHPRHGGKVESRLSNEQEVFDALKRWASSHSECKVNLVNGLFAHMPMKEQVRAIQDASVIVGAHGAGLTHIVAATPNTVILEIISVEFRRPHFQYIAQWKGLKYHAINLDDSYANPSEVIDRLSGIMTSLGC